MLKHKKKTVLYHMSFWTILVLAITAEGWMDLLCHFLFGA